MCEGFNAKVHRSVNSLALRRSTRDLEKSHPGFNHHHPVHQHCHHNQHCYPNQHCRRHHRHQLTPLLIFSDGIESFRRSRSNGPLPNPRLVSLKCFEHKTPDFLLLARIITENTILSIFNISLLIIGEQDGAQQ